MSLRSQYKLDPKKVEQGITVTRDPNPDGSIPTFYLHFMGRLNKEYSKALEIATRPHQAAIQAKRMNNDLAEQIFMDVFVKTVLFGWDNVLLSDVNDNPEDTGFAPFNKENAIRLFNVPGMSILYDELQEEAKNVANFRQEGLEEAAKN